MKAQIVGQSATYDRVKPFGYRSNEQVLRMKLFGATVVVVLPVLLSAIVGLI